MDIDTFWDLADASQGAEDRIGAIADRLQKFTTENIVRFRIQFDDLMHSANRIDLWGAANTLLGKCSEDQFIDFRVILIELGRELFETAVREPDSLADVFAPGQALPTPIGIAEAATVAWTSVTGETEDAFFEAVDAIDAEHERPDWEEGEWWSFENKEEVRHRLPRLAAKFLKDED